MFSRLHCLLWNIIHVWTRCHVLRPDTTCWPSLKGSSGARRPVDSHPDTRHAEPLEAFRPFILRIIMNHDKSQISEFRSWINRLSPESTRLTAKTLSNLSQWSIRKSNCPWSGFFSKILHAIVVVFAFRLLNWNGVPAKRLSNSTFYF